MHEITRRLVYATVVVASLAIFSSDDAYSAPPMPPQKCLGQFLDGHAPEVMNGQFQTMTAFVCYREFSNLVSGETRTPVYSAEHLTRAQVVKARGVSRKDVDFFAEPSLPPAWRAQLDDYFHSGYDRGHMSSWADNADPVSFSLANVVPQNADDNRHLWEGVEAAVREDAKYYGEVYAVSGPIFLNCGTSCTGKWLHKSGVNPKTGVRIPDYLFKAVYIPATGATGVYLVKNAAGSAWNNITERELYQVAGIDPFPSLPMSKKARHYNLRQPDEHGRRIPVTP